MTVMIVGFPYSSTIITVYKTFGFFLMKNCPRSRTPTFRYFFLTSSIFKFGSTCRTCKPRKFLFVTMYLTENHGFILPRSQSIIKLQYSTDSNNFNERIETHSVVSVLQIYFYLSILSLISMSNEFQKQPHNTHTK